MINLNKHRIDFGKGDVGFGVIGNTTILQRAKKVNSEKNRIDE